MLKLYPGSVFSLEGAMGPLVLFFSSSGQRLTYELSVQQVWQIWQSSVNPLVVCNHFQISSIGDLDSTKFAKMMILG